MKILISFIIICFLLNISLPAQNNNILRGKILFLSSGKKPAIGVEISGSIEKIENANSVYTLDDGSFQLIFPKARVGYNVKLQIGEKDKYGEIIEIVNNKEIEICKIPAKVSDDFEIIVCKKGSRDIAAQRYYGIIKNSAEIALSTLNKEMEVLLLQKNKDYLRIEELSEKITKMEQQRDSLLIYKDAFHIASINKDKATKRVLLYIQLMDEGKSIQEAREALSIKGAANDLKSSVSSFNAAIEELETRLGASINIFDYNDIIICCDTLIYYSEKIGIKSIKTSWYYNSRANAFREMNMIDKALDDYNSAISINPKDILAYTNRASLYISQDKVNDAIADLTMAIHIDSNWFILFYARSIIYRKKGLYAEEINDLNKVIALNPKMGQAYMHLGLSYLKKDCTNNEPEKYLLKAVELIPNSYLSHYNLGQFYLNQKRYLDAQIELSSAIELIENDDEVYYSDDIIYTLSPHDTKQDYLSKAHFSRGLANYLFAENNKPYKTDYYNKASKDFDLIIKNDSNHAAAYCYRGIINGFFGNTEYAINDLNKAIALDPNIPISYRYRGICHFQRMEYNQAMQDFDKALEVNPQDADIYLLRGSLFQEINQPEKAAIDFNNYAKLKGM